VMLPQVENGEFVTEHVQTQMDSANVGSEKKLVIGDETSRQMTWSSKSEKVNNGTNESNQANVDAGKQDEVVESQPAQAETRLNTDFDSNSQSYNMSGYGDASVTPPYANGVASDDQPTGETTPSSQGGASTPGYNPNAGSSSTLINNNDVEQKSAPVAPDVMENLNVLNKANGGENLFNVKLENNRVVIRDGNGAVIYATGDQATKQAKMVGWQSYGKVYRYELVSKAGTERFDINLDKMIEMKVVD
jgi:hypothetical protein